MIDSRVNYMGLELASPVIAGSCGLTAKIDNLEQIERAGAGAVVLKSIFEEQIEEETLHAFKAGFGENTPFPGAADYIRTYVRSHSLHQHLDLLHQAKRRLAIPVIASINCFTGGEWIAFARELEVEGADALELNIYIFPTGDFAGSDALEEAHLCVVRATRAAVNIPIAVKLGHHFTHLPAFVDKLRVAGASSVTLFNRLARPDICLDTIQLTDEANPFTTPADATSTLRWTAILAGKDNSREIAASTGVHDGETFVKLLLAGATVVQVCSLLYQRGILAIRELNDYLATWSERHGFTCVDEFRGLLSHATITDPLLYERAQFIKHCSNK